MNIFTKILISMLVLVSSGVYLHSIPPPLSSSKTAVDTIIVNQLSVEPIPITPSLFTLFDIIKKNLNTAKKGDEGTVLKIQSLIDTIITEKLTEDPAKLTQTGRYGLTPAHLLALKWLVFKRAHHFRGIELWTGESEAFKKLFKYAFSRIQTDKAVQADITMAPKGLDEVSYLRESKIATQPMTAEELAKEWHLL